MEHALEAARRSGAANMRIRRRRRGTQEEEEEEGGDMQHIGWQAHAKNVNVIDEDTSSLMMLLADDDEDTVDDEDDDVIDYLNPHQHQHRQRYQTPPQQRSKAAKPPETPPRSPSLAATKGKYQSRRALPLSASKAHRHHDQSRTDSPTQQQQQDYSRPPSRCGWGSEGLGNCDEEVAALLRNSSARTSREGNNRLENARPAGPTPQRMMARVTLDESMKEE